MLRLKYKLEAKQASLDFCSLLLTIMNKVLQGMFARKGALLISFSASRPFDKVLVSKTYSANRALLINEFMEQGQNGMKPQTFSIEVMFPAPNGQCRASHTRSELV